MKISKTDLSLIQPQLLQEDEEVHAWFTLKNPEFNSEAQHIAGLNLGFNTPEDNEVIARNRLILLETLGLDKEWIAYADQVHSNRIRYVTQGGTYPSTDGLITQVPGLTLGIQVADCAAVLLWDADHRIVAALHAGWRGAAGNIVPRGIEKMIEHGAETPKMKAFVSPCLSLKNFEIGTEVADQFPDQFVDYQSYQKPHVDLKGFLKYQMIQSGIPDSHIEIREECTISEADDFYSYRREGDKSGRMMALIQIAN